MPTHKKHKILRAVTAAQSVGFCAGISEQAHRWDFVVLSSPGQGLTDFCRREGVRGIPLPMERHIAPLKDLRSLFRLIRIFRRERPDMVHSMTPKAGMLCMVAAWIARVPVRVHTFTGLVFPTSRGLKRRILMACDWITCACATTIVPEGEGVRRDLLTHGITHKNIRVLGHGNVRGIDLNRFSRSPEVMAEAERIRRPDLFTFIAIGRLVGDKGINELVKAFTLLHSEHPATRLILVGDYESSLDPLRPETLAEIRSNPAIEAVDRQSDVRPWLAAADCAVLASYREGFPNVVIEAGAMGLPQIVTDINGANEIIIPDKNGIIIPSHSVAALHQAMVRILTNPEERLLYAANARPLIASRYEQSFVRACLFDLYDRLLRLSSGE